MPHGDYSLVVKLRFVDPVSRVRFSLVAQMKTPFGEFLRSGRQEQAKRHFHYPPCTTGK